MEPETLRPTPYVLRDLVLDESAGSGPTRPVPPAFAAARPDFGAGCAAYEAQRYAEAARLFLAAARTLRRGPDADRLAPARAAACHNAACALVLAEGAAAAEAALAPLLADDPRCAPAVRRFLDSVAP